MTLIAAPIWWTVAVKLLWNGQQDIEFLAQVFASTKFFGFEGEDEETSARDSDESEDAYERQQRQIEARVTHIRSWLDARCPRMKPALQSEIRVRRENITEAVVKALTIMGGDVQNEKSSLSKSTPSNAEPSSDSKI